MSDMPDLTVDEDGFFCLVAPDTYRGFVDEDWQLEQLLARFAEQMTAGSLFVVYPGPDEADEAVALGERGPSAAVLREVQSIVRVGPAGLWVTDYTQLTMAAQFDDEQPTGSGAVRLPVAEGLHRIHFRQVDGDPRFVLTITPTHAGDPVAVGAIPWFE